MPSRLILILVSFVIGALFASATILHIDNARRAVFNYISLHVPQPVVLMLGDSHIARFDTWGDAWSIAPWQVRNLAVDGYQARQVLSQYRDQLINDNHCVVVVMAGINRAPNETPSDTANALSELIKLARKRAKTLILIETMFTFSSRDSVYVRELNLQLKLLAHQHNIEVVSVNDILSENEILHNNYSEDGLHLNEKGYSVLIKALKFEAGEHLSTSLKKCKR